MANPDHLEWLKEGVEAWNQRRKHDDFIPDLRQANLRGAELRGANLTEAKLRQADLSEAKLRQADLSEAKLSGADVKSVKSNAATNDESAFDFTDLSVTKYLTQAQLNRMDGDTGTLLPEDLTRLAGLS